jgi:penicillin-binding protein-related factor A (putative recombinase)
MQTPEGKVKDEVKKLLVKHGAYYHMPVQNGMGTPTLDFIGCMKGYFFGIETKAPGKKPTPRQLLTIKNMESAGGTCFVIDGDLSELQQWLECLSGQ